MFEQIRNYKGDTAEETERNLKEAMDNWKYTEEIQFAIAKYNATYGTNFDSDVLDDNITTTLASFFELLRKKTKSVVFGTVYGITEIGLADQIQGTKEEYQSSNRWI
nr:hypothetical protein P5658_21695 [Bacillus subtilis]